MVYSVYSGGYGSPQNAERATDKINTQKRMTIGEEKAHTAFTRYLEGINSFRQTKDLSRLSMYFKIAENYCDMPEVKIYAGGLKQKAEKMVANCELNPDNKQAVEYFEQAVLKKREQFEVKKIRQLINHSFDDDGMSAMRMFFEQKNGADLHSSIRSLLEDYTAHRTPENREKYNKALAMVGMQIVEISPKQAALNDKLVARCAFEGAFVFPEKNSEYGYSETYRALMKDTAPRHRTKISDEEFAALPVVQSIQKSENMALMLPQIKRELQNHGIDAATAKELNLYDCARILYDTYGSRERLPQKDELLVFSRINNECEEGVRQTFWKKFARNEKLMNALKQDLVEHNTDPKYIKDLMLNLKENGTVTLPDQQDKYRQPLPTLSVHHKLHIKDVGQLGDVMEVDRMDNFMACVDYGIKDKDDADKRSIHQLRHTIDGRNDAGNFERLVDVKDSADNVLVLSCGLKKDIYIEKNPDNDREQMPTRITYLDIAKKQSEENA